MCGRYVFEPDENLFDRFKIPESQQTKLEANYNVTPGSVMPVVVNGAGASNELRFMRWGLVPPWSKDAKIGYKMINARSETVEEKASFKIPFKTQRCLVPASGFYEWQQQDGQKQPFYIHSPNKMLTLAGLYEVIPDAGGQDFMTYTILTKDANADLKNIHDRMPVILDEEEEQRWIDSQTQADELREILETDTQEKLNAYKISSEVNSPKNNSPALIKKL